MIKRLTDWMEKMSVASLAVGLFQLQVWAILIGIVTFGACMVLTFKLAKGD